MKKNVYIYIYTYIYIYVSLNNSAVQQKVIQHCKSTIFHLKKKEKRRIYKTLAVTRTLLQRRRRMLTSQRLGKPTPRFPDTSKLGAVA